MEENEVAGRGIMLHLRPLLVYSADYKRLQ
jgi:hypothetical protein